VALDEGGNTAVQHVYSGIEGMATKERSYRNIATLQRLINWRSGWDYGQRGRGLRRKGVAVGELGGVIEGYVQLRKVCVDL